MVEAALTVTSSVVSLLTLAGYTLQGVKYLSNILREIKQCPRELNSLEIDLRALVLIIESFQDAPSFPEEPSADLSTALQEIASAIQELKILAEKFKVLQERPKRKKLWKQFWQVLLGPQLAQNQQKLERSKTTLILLQGHSLK